MAEAVLVGLIDSGVGQGQTVAAASAFYLDGLGRVADRPAIPDRAAHGSAVAEIILALAPQARLLNAQVFHGSGPVSPAVVAAALDWVVAQGARVVNMSFGLRQDREILRRACAAAADREVLLAASAPARGGPVFPACYPEVLGVCGDARCGPGEFSALADGPAGWGACPRPWSNHPAGRPLGGASLAAAYLSAAIAGFLADRPESSRLEVMEYLRSLCRFYGRERRGAPAGRSGEP